MAQQSIDLNNFSYISLNLPSQSSKIASMGAVIRHATREGLVKPTTADELLLTSSSRCARNPPAHTRTGGL